MNDLNNKNVIITGASKGIGKKIAQLFSHYKSNIFLISRNLDSLNKIKLDLKNNNRIIECYSSDVKDSLSKVI